MVRRIVHPSDLDLFRFLKQFGVSINLSDDEHKKAVDLTNSFVQKVQKMYQPEIIRALGFDILRQLLQPMELNHEIIEKVISCYPNIPPPEQKDSSEDKTMDANAMVVAISTDQDMEELKNGCKRIGCRLNQDQATNILNRITHFLSDTFTIFSEYESCRKKCMDIFMENVQVYMERLCVLDDVGTVESAVNTMESQGRMYFKKRNIVPAKEEGISTAMQLLKLEGKRERVDMELD